MAERGQYNPEDEVVKEGPNKGNLAANEFVPGTNEDGGEHPVISGTVRAVAEGEQKGRKFAETPVIGTIKRHLHSYVQHKPTPSKEEFAKSYGNEVANDILEYEVRNKEVEAGSAPMDGWRKGEAVVSLHEFSTEQRKAEQEEAENQD
jgi:hypothetical protein